MLTKKSLLINVIVFAFFAILLLPVFHAVHAQTIGPQTSITIQVAESDIGFKIPGLADILTFVIRIFFVIAGLVALLYLLLGAFSWITSSGEEEAVGKARQKITAAVIGVILIVAVLAIIVTLEQVVFKTKICFGISCPATIPSLVRPCGTLRQGNVCVKGPNDPADAVTCTAGSGPAAQCGP